MHEFYNVLLETQAFDTQISLLLSFETKILKIVFVFFLFDVDYTEKITG